MYQAVLADAKFHEQLLVFDRDLAASARAARCRLCGGALHSASYDRKPRGGPAGLGQEYAERFSFCCAVDGCRKRTTPPSLRFLGRQRLSRHRGDVDLGDACSAPRRPAWRVCRSCPDLIGGHWRAGAPGGGPTFTDSPFAPVAMAAVVPPIDIAALPVSLLDRFAGDVREQLIALLRFLGPLTGGASAMRAF